MKNNENNIIDISNEIEYKGNKYQIVFNINVMRELQNKFGSFDNWTSLIKPEDKNKESDIGALIFVFTQMLNEGIEIQNEDEGSNIKPFTEKQVGRIITEIGLAEANKKLSDTVIESTKSTEKNV